MGPLTSPSGKLMRVKNDAGNYVDSTAIKLTDNDLLGRLQANRELLTEVGEFSTQDTVDNVDPNAQTKRGIPYYQKALDLMAQKFAGSWNDANTLPDTMTIMCRWLTRQIKPNMWIIRCIATITAAPCSATMVMAMI